MVFHCLVVIEVMFWLYFMFVDVIGLMTGISSKQEYVKNDKSMVSFC